MFCDTTFFSSTAGQGFQNTKWPAEMSRGKEISDTFILMAVFFRFCEIYCE